MSGSAGDHAQCRNKLDAMLMKWYRPDETHEFSSIF